MSKPCIFSEDEIRQLAAEFRTPFHLYDEKTIRNTCRGMKEAFAWAPSFRNFFAVKATPNPSILQVMKDEGFGADCSSLAELLMSEAVGLRGENIMFTSNNTAIEEFSKAKELGAIINLDDASHLEFVHEKLGLPDLICFRYNPGPLREGNVIIGDPASAKFGVTTEQLPQCFERARDLGVKRFALHTMVVSNCLKEDELVETASMVFNLAVTLKEKHNIRLQFVNLGGGRTAARTTLDSFYQGIGIPYQPTQEPVDIGSLGRRIQSLYNEIIVPAGLDGMGVVYECGRYVTGPAGVLVTRVIHQKNIYKKFIGVDATINALMRPALYGSYHHITVVRDDNAEILKRLPSTRSLFVHAPNEQTTFDVVGSLCENNDKLATDRLLPADLRIGDLLVFHDTGAHGHAMGFNYNGKLRPAEYLKRDPQHHIVGPGCCFLWKHCGKTSRDGNVVEIRKAETYENLFATLRCLPGKRVRDCELFRGALCVVGGLVCGIAVVRLLASNRK